MNKVCLCCLLGVLMLGGVCPDVTAQEKPQYFVVCAWLRKRGDVSATQPIVSNVARASCRVKTPDGDVQVQFSNFCEAFVVRRSGHDYVDGFSIFSYNTSDEAERNRIEFIARYNNDNRNRDAYTVRDFRILCDDR